MRSTYIANGREVILHPDPAFVAIRFREETDHADRAAIVEALDLGPYPRRLGIPGERYTIVPTGWEAADTPGPESFAAASAEVVKRVGAHGAVVRSAPVFRFGRDHAVATERVLVGFRAGAADPAATLASLGFQAEQQSPGEFRVQIPAGLDPLKVSANLRARNDVEYAEPDMVVLVTPLPHGGDAVDTAATAVNDPLAPRQYALVNTRALDARTLHAPSRDVLIAILDGGIDTTHEDLTSAFVAGIDVITGKPFQEAHPRDGHGTACAGLAGAVGNNALGVCGVASGCGLLAVKISQFSDDTTTGASASAGDAARGVRAAADAGAAVVSLSWVFLPSTQLTRAIERARTTGRGGRGCVIVAGVGNDAGPVNFPASLPEVLAVAATNRKNEPKTPTSSDGEKHWGSCFGEEVDIAAPGVANFTTDVTGALGFNIEEGSAGNYTGTFNGTSSAVPIVAGAAALVLSANPDLGERAVRDVLCNSANKVDTVVYDASGHNLHLGFGLLDVKGAVEKALVQRNGGVAPPHAVHTADAHFSGNGGNGAHRAGNGSNGGAPAPVVPVKHTKEKSAHSSRSSQTTAPQRVR